MGCTCDCVFRLRKRQLPRVPAVLGPGRRSSPVSRPPALAAATSSFSRRRHSRSTPSISSQHGIDVLLLLQQAPATIGQQAEKFGELRPFIAGNFIEIEKFRDFGQRKSEPLAAQYQFQSYSLAFAVNPRPAVPARGNQTFVLVETDGARRQREFAGEFRNRVGRLAGRQLGGRTSGRRHGMAGESPMGHCKQRSLQTRVTANGDRRNRPVTIPYRIAGSSPHERPAITPTRLSVRRSAGARRGNHCGPRRALDPDAAAVCARPHQPVAAGGT